MFSPPFDRGELNDFLTRMSSPLEVGRAADELAEQARAFGERLMEALIEDDSVRDLFRQAVDRAKEANEGVRISLKLPAGLMDVPWELLCDRGRFLSHSIHTPVVRSLDLGMASSPHKLTPPLTVLGVVCQPDDFPQLDAEGERQSLDAVLRPLEERGLVRMRWLERATLEELAREAHNANVIHYIGHGGFDNGRGNLLFEEPDGRSRRVDGNRLAGVLQDERSLRLVVLNSCEGARTSKLDPFSGVATSLLNVDIPAVIAMQFGIADSAALDFSKSIYEALAESLPIDAALARARRALLASPNEIAFATPVLFLQRRETQLFQGQGQEPMKATASPPSAAKRPADERSEPVAARSETNRSLVLAKAEKLEGTLYTEQKKALLKEIREDEELLLILRCGLGNEMTRSTVLVLTSDRAITVRESVVRKVSVKAIPWRDVYAVSDEGEAVRLDLRDGPSITLTRIKGSGFPLSHRVDKLDSSSIVTLIEEMVPAGFTEVEDRAEFNRQRLASLLGSFTMKPYPDQKNTMLEAVEGDEELLAICRCAGEEGGMRSFVLLLTSKRLLSCRERLFGNTEIQSLPWTDIRTVSTRDAFLDFIRHDGKKISFSRFKEGKVCDGRDIGFDPPALRRAALDLIEQND